MQRFTARAVVVGDRAGTVVPDAVVDGDDGEIRWVGPAADAPPAPDAQLVDLPGALLPGRVNSHSHAPMVLFRGQAEGLPLDRWLREVIWPREARLTGDDVEVAMTAASAEMLRNGVTTSVEMYFSPERIAAAVTATGARAVIASPPLPLPGVPPPGPPPSSPPRCARCPGCRRWRSSCAPPSSSPSAPAAGGGSSTGSA